MKKAIKSLFILSAFLLTGCQPEPTPTPDPTPGPVEDEEEKPSEENPGEEEPVVEEFNAGEFLLETLKGDIGLSMNFKKAQVNIDTGIETNPEVTILKTYLGSDEYFNQEIKDGEVIEETHYFKNAEGVAVTRKPSIDNSELIDTPVMDNTYEDAVFDDNYLSPFKDLSLGDFTVQDELTFVFNISVFNSEHIHSVCTMYSGNLTSLIFEVDKENKQVNFEYVAEFSYEDNPNIVRYTGEGSVVSKEKIGITEVKLFEKTAESQLIDEKLALLNKQQHAFKYTIIDPDDNSVDETYEVIVNPDIVYIKLTEDGVTSEYGFMDTEEGYIDFDVVKEGDKVQFVAKNKATKDKTVADSLVDFSMAGEFFTFKDGQYSLRSNLGLNDYLDRFLPSTFIDNDSYSVDEETFKMNISDSSMKIEYDYSYGVRHKVIEVTSFVGAKIPYDNYEIVHFTNPTSWAEVDFYEDLVTLLGSEERVNDIPFVYPDLGWTFPMVFPGMGWASLMGEFSSEEVAREAANDYNTDLIMNGFMMSESSLTTYEKDYEDMLVEVEATADGADFTIYISVSQKSLTE